MLLNIDLCLEEVCGGSIDALYKPSEGSASAVDILDSDGIVV